MMGYPELSKSLPLSEVEGIWRAADLHHRGNCGGPREIGLVDFA
jgi:hypothetical protein